MSESADSTATLKELEFEVEEGRGPRFLLAVCDDDERAAKLRMSLDAYLKQHGREPVEVVTPVNAANLVDVILAETRSGIPGVVHLIQAKDLPAKASDKFFGELNFQRDSLAKLGVPFILWLYGTQLPTLASRAPDFWSRRTAIFYFDTYSFTALIDRIFSQFTAISNVKADEISKALREILSCERELQTCLLSRRHFSLPKADSFIEKLRSSVQVLIAECTKGRKLDVALWLWNASHMDTLLRRRKANDHLLAQATFLEFNDLLLLLAKRIDKVLRQYSAQLEQKIRDKQDLSLVQVFVKYALNLWAQMVRSAKKQVENFSAVKLDELPDAALTASNSSERMLKQYLADRLEAWLAGETDEKPSILSDEEAKVLKYLYMSKSDQPLPKPVPFERIKHLVPQLRTKVRLLLGDIRF
jgi:hypothetical protein